MGLWCLLWSSTHRPSIQQSCWLQATLADLQQGGQTSFAQFRSEVTDLRKFVVLNYIAVIKAFKKRNRHLQVIHLPASMSLERL